MKGEINEKEETNRGRKDPEKGGHREARKGWIDAGEEVDADRTGWLGYKVTNEPNIQSVPPPLLGRHAALHLHTMNLWRDWGRGHPSSIWCPQQTPALQTTHHPGTIKTALSFLLTPKNFLKWDSHTCNKEYRSSPSLNQRLRGGTDITEAGGRPAAGRRCDAEDRHNYLSRLLSMEGDGSRGFSCRFLFINPQRAQEPPAGQGLYCFLNGSPVIRSPQRLRSYTTMDAHGLIVVTLIKLCWLPNSNKP